MRKIFFLLTLLLSSCGYHFQNDALYQHYSTIAVPYIKGDTNGIFTDILIKELSQGGKFQYVDRNPMIILKGEIITDKCEHIGYQYDRKDLSGELINRLVPNEGRRDVTIRISLINALSNEVLSGPYTVSATSDYDFVDPNSAKNIVFTDLAGNRVSVLAFSIGQLDSVEGAKEAALIPLYQSLAEKIVAGIENLE